MSDFIGTRRQLFGVGLCGGSLALAASRRSSVAWGGQGGASGGLRSSPIVDIHCHTFCTADLPIVGFLAHHVPWLPEISRFLTKWPETAIRALVAVATKLPNAAAPTGDEELGTLRAALAEPQGGPLASVDPLPRKLVEELVASLAKKLPFTLGETSRRAIGRYLETIHLAAHARGSIAATLVKTYADVALFTPMLVDYDAWSEDQAPTPLATQILLQESISRLACAGRVGRPDARMHSFVAFDPRRQAAHAETPSPTKAVAREPGQAPPLAAASPLEMVRYAVGTGGFLGVKLYPSVGFAPGDNARLRPREPYAAGVDRALEGLYQLCEAEEIPVTTHTSAANEYAFGLRELASPRRWTVVLAAHPGLRLNLAHFGHDYGVEGEDTSRAWLEHAAMLMNEHPHVYADLSNSPLVYDAPYAARFRGLLAKLLARFPKVKKRMMFGTDWWLANLDADVGLAAARFRAVFSAFLSPDEVDDLLGRNALRFLGFLDEDNQPRNGLAARRLRAFYGPLPLPPWLPR